MNNKTKQGVQDLNNLPGKKNRRYDEDAGNLIEELRKDQDQNKKQFNK